MIITKSIEEQLVEILKKEKITVEEWNEIVPFLKNKIIDISEPLPFQTCYIGSSAFHCIFMFKRHFYSVEGSLHTFVQIKCIDEIPIRKVYFP